MILVSIIILLYACKKDVNLASNVKEEIPSYFPPAYYNNTINNPPTEQGFQLGRALFYDPILSIDSTISCASCHNIAHAFADHNLPISTGVGGAKGTRNSPALFNLQWNKSFMWDGGINHIEVMSLAPLTNPLEMQNTSMSDVINRLSKSTKYQQAFELVFPNKEINDQNLFFALAQFMAKLNSVDSKYDQVRQGKAVFTAAEADGYLVFKTNCAICHQEPLFTDYSFRNNGTDSSFIDKGRYLITLNTDDLGKFKVPSLRNVAITYPYMHNGKLKNLEDVITQYENPQISATIDPFLLKPIQLTVAQKANLIAFINTLTDYTFIANPKFSEP